MPVTPHARVIRARYIALVICALALVALAPKQAEACVCVSTASGNPACQARWQYNEIFVGRVTSIGPPPANTPNYAIATTHFAVTESFAGVSSETYDVVNGGSTCDYHFEVGKEYLVYANRGDVAVCSPTMKLENAADDLKYLRAIPAARPRNGRIIGIAIHDEPSFAPQDRKPEPFAGMRIVAEGEGLRRSATTGRDGKYEIRVPAGKYRLHAEPSTTMYADDDRDVELRDSRGCAVADFDVRFNGHVNGRVVRADGQPVPFLTIELTPPTPTNAHAEVVGRTDENGRIRLEHVPPGSFILGHDAPSADFHAVYLPGTATRGDARVIDVKPSGTVDAGTLVIPASMHFVTLSGVARDAAGGPLKRACIWIRTDDAKRDSVSDCVATAADGTFAIAVPEGRKYVVLADGRDSPNDTAEAELTGVVATADMKPLVITLTRKKS